MSKDDKLSSRIDALPPEKRALLAKILDAQARSKAAAGTGPRQRTQRNLDALPQTWDVVIMGGGLAGLALALQLVQRRSDIRVLVIEKSRHPVPEAAHKVGESSVEIAGHYFGEVLGLKDHIQTSHLKKLGLRFFFGAGDNRDLGRRLEVGAFVRRALVFPSYQLDRGRFENFLGAECERLGVTFLDECTVSDLDLAAGGRENHEITVRAQAGTRMVRAPWVVDATGRAALIKKRLRLSVPEEHYANAAWFRVSTAIDIEDWCQAPSWRARIPLGFRQFSTNHLMGPGYWVWLIPLASGATSIGVVTDGTMYPISEINSLERVLEWLRVHEPECFRAVSAHRHRIADFLVLKRYSRGCSQVVSTDRWSLVGESGLFTDPFYSPGSDFIAYGNTLTADLILRDMDGESIDERVAFYNWFVIDVLYEAGMSLFRGQYPLMGNPQVMSAKIVWDFAVYWYVVGLVFIQDAMCDLDFMQSIRDQLERFVHLQKDTQRFFQMWHQTSAAGDARDRHVDFTYIEFLYQAHCSMGDNLTRAELAERLRENLDRLEVIAAGMRRRAGFGHAPSTEQGALDPAIERDLDWWWIGSTTRASGEDAP